MPESFHLSACETTPPLAEVGGLSPAPTGSEDLEQVILAYLQAIDDGQRPDVDQLLADHPALAEELGAFLKDEQEVRQQARPLREALCGSLSLSLAAEEGPPLTSLGGYERLVKITEGGMGVVYRAWQPQARREVAVKVMRSRTGEPASSDERRRFLEEARKVAGLEHPNIIIIHEVGTTNDQPYFSMEFARGGALAGRVAELRKAPRRAAELLQLVARAVGFAHQRGIIHRDLKPANILLAASGAEPSAADSNGDSPPLLPLDRCIPKVGDFGLAKSTIPTKSTGAEVVPLLREKHLGDTASYVEPPRGQTMPTVLQTAPGAIVGTPAYMAPEQARGEAGLTTAVDVYGLGAILYTLLTGQPPFLPGCDSHAILRQVRESSPVAPRTLDPKIDPDLEAICLKCMRKAPEERYDSAAKVAEDLQRFLEGKPVEARPATVHVRLRLWVRREPVTAALIAAVVMLTAVLLAAGVWQVVRILERQAEDQRSLYSSNMPLAELLFQTGKVDRANKVLDACPQELLGWDWHYLRRLCHRRQVRLTGHTRNAISLCYSPRGDLLLTGGEDGTARLWDAHTGKQIYCLPGHVGRVKVCFTADGRSMITAGQDQDVRFWDTATGKEQRLLKGGGNLTVCDRQGRWLVAAGRANRPPNIAAVLTLHDLTHKGQGWRKQFSSQITCMAISSKGDFLALGFFDRRLELWELPSGKVVPLAPHNQNEYIWAVAFSHDGRNLAASLPRPVLWEVPSRKIVRTFPGAGLKMCAMLDFSPDDRFLAAPSSDGLVRVWDVKTNRGVNVPVKHNDIVFGAAFSPDGKSLAFTRGWDVIIESLDWEQLARRELTGGHQRTDLEALAFSGDSKQIASRAGNGEIVVWDVQTGKPRLVGRNPGKGGGLTFYEHKQRNWLLAGAGEHLVAWDATTGDPVSMSLPCGPIGCMARPGDGVLAVSDGARRITVVNVERRTEWGFRSGTAQIQALAYHAASKRLASCGTHGRLQVQTPDDEKRTVARDVVTLVGHSGPVMGATFSRDGRLLASCGADLTVRLWDVRQGRPLQVLSGHEGGVVVGVAFTPDGKRLASCGNDGVIKIWDVESGAELLTLEGHRSHVTAVAFSPDGNLLASCGHDGVVRIWDGTPLEHSKNPRQPIEGEHP